MLSDLINWSTPIKQFRDDLFVQSRSMSSAPGTGSISHQNTAEMLELPLDASPAVRQLRQTIISLTRALNHDIKSNINLVLANAELLGTAVSWFGQVRHLSAFHNGMLTQVAWYNRVTLIFQKMQLHLVKPLMMKHARVVLLSLHPSCQHLGARMALISSNA
jgi:hypothetical protein